MRIVTKKCSADKDYDNVEKFAILAGKIITNQREEKKEEGKKQQTEKPAQKKKGKGKKNR